MISPCLAVTRLPHSAPHRPPHLYSVHFNLLHRRQIVWQSVPSTLSHTLFAGSHLFMVLALRYACLKARRDGRPAKNASSADSSADRKLESLLIAVSLIADSTIVGCAFCPPPAPRCDNAERSPRGSAGRDTRIQRLGRLPRICRAPSREF